MWNCAADNGNVSHQQRGNIYLLIGALLVCVLLYLAWGPLLLISLALVLVVHTCYSLLVNDSLFAPHSLVLLGYAKQLAWELAVTLESLSLQGVKKLGQLSRYLGTLYAEWTRRQTLASAANCGLTANNELDDDMMNGGRNRRTYSLSTTGNELVNQVSPIVKDPYRTFALNGAHNVGRTSTPLPRGSTWKKDVQQPNGNLGLFAASSTPTIKKQSPTRTENSHPSPSQMRSDDSLYGPKGSPWAANSSPKLRERPVGVKTVQTVAGPLLASTRYNIDPKLYTDISSPGLTSRLTKYAAEASNKLTHQPQYAAGQFPKVNLNASPIPLLSPKVARARIPVTVRVAPPDIVNYSPVDTHQERPKVSPNSSPNSQELKESKSFPSVTKTLKKLPLKRHTSREDIMLDLAKKQRFERIFDGELENLEEMMQKRAREESMASDEDGSPQSKNERPLKRSKASSCHDVINSLSSSINVYTGIKRKAMDTSRCNTPSIEKHFKPSSTSPTPNSPLTPLSSGEIARSREQLNVKVPVISTVKEVSPPEPMEKNPDVTKPDGVHSPERPKSPLPNALNLPTPKARRDVPVPTAIKPPTKLTDKLFMRAEPQDNEKIRTMIEDQGKVEAKFTTDDNEEIKKEDIVNMRQNSMRLRLQSMFDAISGKTSQINPDVVIQAEEVNPPSTSNYTSLSCQTSTTTVNASPITTTIVPILKTDAETKSPTNKHVTFNLPSSHSSTLSSASSTLSTAAEVTTKPAEMAKLPTSAPNFNFSSSTSAAPSFGFGSNAATTTASTATAPTSTTSSTFSFPASSIAASVASSKIELNAPKTAVNTNVSTSLFNAAAKPTAASSTAPTLGSTQFSFGAAAAKEASTAATIAPTFSFSASSAKTTGSSMPGAVVTSTFGNPLAKSPQNTSLAQTTSLSNFGGDKKDQSTFAFGAAAAAASSSPSVSSTTTTSQAPSIFGSTTMASSPMFSAGSNNNPPPPYSAPSATTTSAPAATPMFSFGGAGKPPSTFSFGGSTAPAATTAASTVTPTFGSGTATASTGFGALPAAASNPSSTTSTPAPAFGTSTPSLFGAQTTSSAPSLFSSASAATNTTTASSMFKPPSTTPSFGAPQTATTTAPATTSIFGSQSGVPSFGASAAAPSTTGMFGNTTAPAANTSLFGNAPAATTTTPSAFGGAQQSSIFSGANAATASTSSIFGATTSAAPSAGGLFSGPNTANQAPAANTSNTGSIFGQAKPQSSISFGGATSAFGSTAAASSFAAPNATSPSTFSIGAAPSTTASLPAFGSIKPTTQFGSPSVTQPSVTNPATSSIFGAAPSGGSSFGASAAASSGSSFGASTAPAAFGANSNATPAFGATSPTNNAFGMPSASASAPTFGSSSTASFGSSTGNATSPFGAPQQPATTSTPSLFGNAAPAGTSTAVPSANSTFGFGGSQTAQPVAPQPTAGSFSFGPAANSGGPGVFQFGGPSNAPKPAGFNFSAPSSAPQINFTSNTATTPAFNAPAPNFQPPGANMFNIGSGSTTPRSRTGRPRRQR